MAASGVSAYLQIQILRYKIIDTSESRLSLAIISLGVQNEERHKIEILRGVRRT